MTAERAALLRDRLLTCKGPDKGGGRTLHEEEWGRPIWTLALSTYEIFEMLGIKPTSTPEGHYYKFAAKVHELVTRQEIGVTEKNKKSSRVGLKDAIAKAVMICGRLGDLRNKQSRDFRQVGGPVGGLTAAEEEELRQLQSALRHGRSQEG